MRSIIGYLIILSALAALSLFDFQTAESRPNHSESAYYSEASFAKSSFNTSNLRAKASQKKEVAVLNERLAVWPERVLKVGQRNFLLAQAVAIKSDDFRKNMGRILVKKGLYTIFSPNEEMKFDGFTLAGNRLPVVVGEVGGELGVVTGNVVVKVASPEVAGLVASLVKSEIVSVSDTTNTATLRMPAGQDLTEVIHTIRNYKGVESADFLIVTKGT